MKWGLVPGWAKDEKIDNRMINAGAQTLAQKLDTPQGTKRPYYIHWAGDEPRVFAGLWESWNDLDGDELLTLTIITTAANDGTKAVHDRIPVILSRPEAERWLSAKCVARRPQRYAASLL